MTDLNKKDLENMKLEVKKMIRGDWAGVWNNGLNSINLDFISDTLSLLQEYVPICQKILKEISIEVSTREYNVSCKIKSPTDDNVKILVVQTLGMNVKTMTNRLDCILKEDKSGRKPDFVIFPENSLKGSISKIEPTNDMIQALGSCSKKHGCYVVWGSTMECVSKKLYNTSIMTGPEGELIGSYRKRKPLVNRLTPGDKNAIFETKFGKVAIMICFDVENQDIFQEVVVSLIFSANFSHTLLLRPKVLF